MWIAGGYPTKICLDSRHIFYRRRMTWIYSVNFGGKHFYGIWILWFLLNRQSGVESQHLLHVCIVPLSFDFVASRWQKKTLLITYRAPCKQGGPRNFYIKEIRVLNAIGTSGALFPGVVWLEHEASQSHSSTELTFKSHTCIHGVHTDDSSRPELAWNGWVRSE